jgi:hypothetical protein
MAGKPTPEEVRVTARKVDRYFANLESRERNLKRAAAIVRAIRSVPKRHDTMPDLVKRR